MMKTIMKTMVSVLVIALLVNPVPGKAFVPVAIPALIEGASVLATSAESAYAALAGTTVVVAGREAFKKVGSYATKRAIKSYVKPKLIRHLMRNAGIKDKKLLKDIKKSNVVFSVLHRPLAGKQLLYYISLSHKGKTYYKIGITQMSLKNRYRREFRSAKVDPILMLEMPKKSALSVETFIKTAFMQDRVNNREILQKDGGYTEVYGRDVLHLDGYATKILKIME